MSSRCLSKFCFALFATTIVTLGLSGPSEAAKDVDCSRNQSISDAVNRANQIKPKIINITGTCEEDLTITRDDVVLTGGTLVGSIDVIGARRVTIEGMVIDGSANGGRVVGVRIRNGAFVVVRNSEIINHTRDGISVERASTSNIEGNTISNNAEFAVRISQNSVAFFRGTAENTQMISANTSARSTAALGIFNGAVGRLNGGNIIRNSGSRPTISIFHDAEFRASAGSNLIENTGGGNAITATVNNSIALSWFEINGNIFIGDGTQFAIQRRVTLPDPNNPPNITAVVNGNIFVRRGSNLRFPSPYTPRNSAADQGSPTVNGTVSCSGNEAHITFSTSGGQTLAAVFPDPNDRAASQCNDWDGNIVFPAP